jgi:hypothetical protein
LKSRVSINKGITTHVRVMQFKLIKLLVCHTLCVCVGEIIPLPWFYKELKNDLSKNNCLCGVTLILLVRKSIFVGWGFPFPILLVPRYELSLCHTPIKPDLPGFLGISVFAYGLRDHVIARFTSSSKYTTINLPMNARHI